MLRFKGDSTSVKAAFDLKSKKKKSKKEKKKDKKNLKSQQDSDSDNSDAASESDGIGLPSVFKRKKVDDDNNIDEQDASKKKAKKQKKESKDNDDNDNGDLSLQKPNSSNLAKEPPSRLQGSGRIVCTSDTVSGFNCKFHEELQPLDTIEILHPATLQIETRVVDQVLGNRSCLLKEPFSRNFSTTTEYMIIKTSERKKVGESETQTGANLDHTKKSKAKKKKLKKSDSSSDESNGDENNNIQILRDDFGHPIDIIGNTNSASSTDGPHSDLRTIQIREKKTQGSGGGGSYRTVAKQIQGGATNALEERMKQGRDKFCW